MVSEITTEIRICDRQRHRELVKPSSTVPGIKDIGMNTEIRGNAHRDDREADLGAAAQRRFARTKTRIEMAHGVRWSTTTMSTDGARADGQRHQREIVDVAVDC